MKTRDYAFDNIKFIMIILVVFGHFLEIATGYEGRGDLYRIIYSFHMPVLFFISGYFAKFSKNRILKSFVLYIIFQLAYIAFSNLFLNTNLLYQTLIPYWIMWYLLVYFFYICLIPLLYSENKKYESIIIGTIITLFLYFITPYFFEKGDMLSILRFFNFMPYFAAGLYFKKTIGSNMDTMFKNKKTEKKVKLIFLILAVLSTFIIAYTRKIDYHQLYGTYKYEESYSPITKLILLLCAFSWIGFFNITLRINKKIPVITNIGNNTLVVFLLHGFVVEIAKENAYFIENKVNMLLMLLLSIFVVFILGNIRIKEIADKLFKKNKDSTTAQ